MSKVAEIAKIYEIHSIEDADFIVDQCIKDGYYSVNDKVAYLVGKYNLSNMQIKPHDVIESVSQNAIVTKEKAAIKSKRHHTKRFVWDYQNIEENDMNITLPVQISFGDQRYYARIKFNKIPSLKDLKEKYGEDKKGRSQYITERKLLNRQIANYIRKSLSILGLDNIIDFEAITNAAWSPIEKYFPYEKPYKN